MHLHWMDKEMLHSPFCFLKVCDSEEHLESFFFSDDFNIFKQSCWK